mmetsp:Transcript_39569/g.95141  ORF Transcript_39569/g.95141 Transcript_39569/m.95141 type:complete len:84 (+) Transcript_39569:645-896(+)
MQDSFAFDPKKLLVDTCAVCGHRSMIRLDDTAVVDAENNRRRAAASAHGGDGKFEAALLAAIATEWIPALVHWMELAVVYVRQ